MLAGDPGKIRSETTEPSSVLGQRQLKQPLYSKSFVLMGAVWSYHETLD
jgi:hypothetical protein